MDTLDQDETYSISEQLLQALVAKGFSENAIKKSIVSGCIDEGTCTQWITMHEGHEELDTPLPDGVVVNVKVKRFLSEEEKKAKVEELRIKALEKKAAEKEKEKAEGYQKEIDRIQFMRDSAVAEQRRKELIREREMKEKEEEKARDAEAKFRIKLQLRIDRLVRGGVKEEDARIIAEKALREEQEKIEKEAAANREAALAARREYQVASSSAPFAAPPVNPLVTMRNIYDAAPASWEDVNKSIQRLNQAGDATVKTRSALKSVLANICNDPLNTKFRLLRVTSTPFQTQFLSATDSIYVLRWCNFDLGESQEGAEVLMCNTVVMRLIQRVLAVLA